MANSSSRYGARVIWITVHTAEGIRKASDLKAFFDRSTNSSAHAVADDSTLLDNLVPYDRAAWTLRNGNARSDNLELCGFAKWSRDEWLNNHQGMLNNAAIWIRNRCRARGIPIRKLSAAEVAAGKAGVIGHVDYTNGTGDGTHWDPGPGFPWDVVIARAAGGDAPVEKDEDMAVVGKPAEDDYICVPANGKTGLCLGVAYGRKVRILEMWAVGDTPAGSGSSVRYIAGGFDWVADRPGPYAIGANVRSVTVRYKADHDFTAWCD